MPSWQPEVHWFWPLFWHWVILFHLWDFACCLLVAEMRIKQFEGNHFLVKLDHLPQTSWVNKFTKSLLTLLATSFWRLWTLLLALSGYCASEHCGWETWQQIGNHCKHWQIETLKLEYLQTFHLKGYHRRVQRFDRSCHFVFLSCFGKSWSRVMAPFDLSLKGWWRTSPKNPLLLSGWNSNVFRYTQWGWHPWTCLGLVEFVLRVYYLRCASTPMAGWVIQPCSHQATSFGDNFLPKTSQKHKTPGCWPAVPPTMLRHSLDDVFDKRQGFGDRNISTTWTNSRTTTSCEICLALRFGSTAGTSKWKKQFIWCLDCCCWSVFSEP